MFQNRAAQTTLRMPRTEHTTPLLRMLHWLPISSRIAYKIDSLCHTALTTAYPKYLSELLNVYTPARPLHSSLDPNILNITAARTKSYEQRAFSYQGPINWNRVPGGIRTVEEKDTFKRHLKTAIFSAECLRLVFCFIIIFILLFIITFCLHCCSVLFPCDCLTFWVLCLVIVYVSLMNTYYVLCMCCHFLLLTSLSTM